MDPCGRRAFLHSGDEVDIKATGPACGGAASGVRLPPSNGKGKQQWQSWRDSSRGGRSSSRRARWPGRRTDRAPCSSARRWCCAPRPPRTTRPTCRSSRSRSSTASGPTRPASSRAASSSARDAPRDKEILSARLIDRPLRPLFPDGFANETQIFVYVISADQENDADVIALTGASLALNMCRIPFAEPGGGRAHRPHPGAVGAEPHLPAARVLATSTSSSPVPRTPS